MALNSSGPISIGGSTVGQSINLELGLSATATSSLNDTALRTLAGVASGAISLLNFYGKANSTLITTNTHVVSWGPGITIGLDLYSGTTPSVKNPTVYFSMGGSNGSGETSDRREYWCYAKRASDNVWVQIMYSAHENDVTAGSDSHTQNITLSDGTYYNQFRYRMSGGFGQNTYWCNSYVDQYWT